MTDAISNDQILPQVADIVAAYLSRNAAPLAEIPELIRSVHASISSLGTPAPVAETAQVPAVPIRKSVTPDFIICLEDGKKLKMLKRHLRTTFNLSPDEYRAKWNLPSDYPMVAPNYAAARSQFAKQAGLGRKPGDRAKAKATKK